MFEDFFLFQRMQFSNLFPHKVQQLTKTEKQTFFIIFLRFLLLLVPHSPACPYSKSAKNSQKTFFECQDEAWNWSLSKLSFKAS